MGNDLDSLVAKRWHIASIQEFRKERLHWLTFCIIALQSFAILYMSRNPKIHVVDILPTGEAAWIKDPLSNTAPRDVELFHLGKKFIQNFWGWSGTDIALDMREALSMCSPKLRERLLKEIESSKILQTLPKDRLGLWSQVIFKHVNLVSRDENGAKIRISAAIERFSSNFSSSKSIGTSKLDLELKMRFRRRSPLHPSGIEIDEIFEQQPKILEGE